MQKQIEKTYAYYNDLYHIFDADEDDEITLSAETVTLLKSKGSWSTWKSNLKITEVTDSHNNVTATMVGGVKNIVDAIDSSGKVIKKEESSSKYGMRTLRDALEDYSARGSIMKAGAELNAGIEGELDRIEYLCKLSGYATLDYQINDCISDIETMLGIEWEGHDSGHRIYSAYELRQIRNSHTSSGGFDAINHDFVYDYDSLSDYKEKYGGYVDEDNGIYNNVFPYTENQFTHYYPFLFVEGLEVQGASAATDILFHYGDWLTDNLWADDPATTGTSGEGHKYHCGNSAADKLNEIQSLLQKLKEISEESSSYWTDNGMKNYKSQINQLVEQAESDMAALQTAFKNYQTLANDVTKGALEEKLETAWGSYNDLYLYLTNDYTRYSGNKKIKDIENVATVEMQNGMFTITEKGKVGDLITLIGGYKSFYNTVAKACAIPVISSDMETLWQLDLQLREVEKTIELWQSDSTMGTYYADAKKLVTDAEKALEEFIKVAGKSKDTDYTEKLKTAWTAYWNAYCFFDQSSVKDANVAADRFDTKYSKDMVGSGYEGTRRLRAVFGSDSTSDDTYKNGLSSFADGTSIKWPYLSQLKILSGLKDLKTQVDDLQKVTDENSKFWTDEGKMGLFKEEVNSLLENIKGNIDTILEDCKDPETYDSKREEIKNKLYEAWDYCDEMYRFFDDDSRCNAKGVRITNIVDALDSTGKTEEYDEKNRTGGMRSLRSQIDTWRSSLKSLAESAKATIPSSTLRDFQYILKRLEDVKALSGSPSSDSTSEEKGYWNDSDMSKHKTTVDGMVDKAISAMEELISAYETYKKDGTDENKTSYLAKMNTAWNRLSDLYDFFNSKVDNKDIKDIVDVVDADLGLTVSEGDYKGMRSLRTLFSAGIEKLESRARNEKYELKREGN